MRNKVPSTFYSLHNFVYLLMWNYFDNSSFSIQLFLVVLIDLLVLYDILTASNWQPPLPPTNREFPLTEIERQYFSYLIIAISVKTCRNWKFCHRIQLQEVEGESGRMYRTAIGFIQFSFLGNTQPSYSSNTTNLQTARLGQNINESMQLVLLSAILAGEQIRYSDLQTRVQVLVFIKRTWVKWFASTHVKANRPNLSNYFQSLLEGKENKARARDWRSLKLTGHNLTCININEIMFHSSVWRINEPPVVKLLILNYLFS